MKQETRNKLNHLCQIKTIKKETGGKKTKQKRGGKKKHFRVIEFIENQWLKRLKPSFLRVSKYIPKSTGFNKG